MSQRVFSQRLGAYYSAMKMHLETSDQNLISNYGKGVLSVNGQDFRQNILITRTRVVEDWFSGPLSELSLSHFDPLFDGVESVTHYSFSIVNFVLAVQCLYSFATTSFFPVCCCCISAPWVRMIVSQFFNII